MSVKTYFKESKSPYAFWLWLLYLAIVVAVSFCLFSLFFFFLHYVLRYGLSIETFKATGLSSITFMSLPSYLYRAYETWFAEFQLARVSNKMNMLLLLPHLAVVSTVVLFLYMIFTCPLRKRGAYFASTDEIERYGLLGNGAMLFGRIADITLKAVKNASALIWFGKGLGKTTSIAIPTILNADDTNVIAVDCSGILPRFSSGYRAKIGKVFNFNWDRLDNPAKGEYYPRWNPLSHGNMPKKDPARNNYIKFVSQYLVIKDANNYWEKLAGTTLEGLIHFFVSKIEQAMANDYFLTRLQEAGSLNDEEKSILYSYYQYMSSDEAEEAIRNLEEGEVTFDNYLPIGTWYNIPPQWQGRDLSLSMIVDTLVHRYCSANSGKENDSEVIWKNMLGEYMAEAGFFGYNPKFSSVFEYLDHLSKKQRWVVFSIVLDSLSIFRKESIRERTSLSDFTVHDVRGIINEETGEKELVTVYSGAYTRESAFMTAFFMDMLLVANIQSKNTSSPLLFLLDDFELLPRIKLLSELLDVKEEANISTMLLTNDMDSLSETYNTETVGEVINKTTYKLISAEDNQAVVQRLSQLSIYDKEANEINMKSGIDYVANPDMAFKSQTYRALSRDLMSPMLKNAFSKGKYLLLVEGHYDLPIKSDSLFFAKNYDLKVKAALREIDNVNEIVLRNRHRQDSVVPDILDVVKGTGVKISSKEDLEKYLYKQRNLLTDNISKIKESETTKRESSDKWQNTKKQKLETMKIEKLQEEDSWWLGEDAFGSSLETKKANPFDN
ncbi:MAG: type IV secretory system conjugative DNA transfer family protein [Lactobacillaceae bacterium]|jgi:type IV secretory pathway TraG/TraD family ATPase VirD4|nr:type IV secretory system conjugative DNA transfer family protein [Lactobacillaceae bacterium]